MVMLVRNLCVHRQAAREVLTDDAFVKPPSYSNLAAVFGWHGLFISGGAKYAGQWRTSTKHASVSWNICLTLGRIGMAGLISSTW
jgi:hypothetical protein